MTVRVVFNGQSEDIASIEEFGSALDRFDRSGTFELWLSAADGASMAMLRSQSNAWLMYLRHDGDAGFHSMGQPALSGTATYTLSNGQVDDYPRAWCLDVELCYKALAYFFVNEGVRPTTLHQPAPPSPAAIPHAQSLRCTSSNIIPPAGARAQKQVPVPCGLKGLKVLATRIALGLWNAGLVSQEALIAWVDGRIRANDSPSSELLDLSWYGPVVCLKRPEFEFPARPIRFTFAEEFSLRALALDVSDDLEAAQFVVWVSHCCMGEDLSQPEVSLGYQLDHLCCDCDDTPSAVRLLRVELPRLMPRCHALASVFLAEVPDMAFQRSSGGKQPVRHQSLKGT